MGVSRVDLSGLMRGNTTLCKPSMVTFLLAFSLECFDNNDDAAITIMGVIWFIVGSLVIWCLYTGWEIEEQSTWAKIKSIFGRVVHDARQKTEYIQHWHDELKQNWTCGPRITEETPSVVNASV